MAGRGGRTRAARGGEKKSRARRAPARGRRGGLLGLQSEAGNRSVGALMSQLRQRFAPPPDTGPGLTVLPPGGRAEVAADKVADQALARRGPQPTGRRRAASMARLSGGDLSGGQRLAGDLSRRITARQGRGRALSAHVRRQLEPKLGVDLGRVRVHTDRASGELTKTLGAEAFAVGRDVFFGRGKFDPDTRSGKRRLMHELTHTVQQSGVERQHGRARPKLGRPGLQAVQCIISPGSFRRLTKHCEAISEGETRRFQRILTKLEAVFTAEQDASKESKIDSTRKKRLRSLRNECRSYSDKDYHLRGLAYEKARWPFVSALKGQAERELGEHVLEFTTRELDSAEQQEKQEAALLEMEEKEGVGYTATIWAHIDHPDYSTFAKVRAQMVYENKLKVSGKKTSAQIKEDAAWKVAEDKFGSDGDKEEILAYATAMFNADCGHTWISFEQVDTSNKDVLDQKSFGFWPAESGSPTKERRGEVRYPDETYTTKSGTRKQAHDISLSQYKDGLREAFKWYLSPPKYLMVKRNCTTFARDVAAKAGVTMPSSYWVTPFYKDEVWNPNDLFDQMED